MKKILFIIITLILLSSCGLAPNYSEDDIVRINGRILNPDGSPYSEKEIGMWIISLEGLSLNNYWYADPDDWEITNENGEFEFARKGSAFITGNSTNYIVIANIDSLDGPIVSAGFYPYDLENEIPELTLWNGDLSSEQTGETVQFSWASGTVDDNMPDFYTLSVRKFYYDLWRDSVSDKSCSAEAYVFQGFDNGWRVEAVFAHKDKKLDKSYHYISGIKNESFQSDAPQLLSAGKPCYIEGRGDSVFTKITNQIFHEWEWMFNDIIRYFIIDLEDQCSIEALAVYGMNGSNDDKSTGFEVYVSSDTLDWGNAAGSTAQSEGYFLIENLNAAGRYVKLQMKEDSDYNINLVKEIAVFGTE
ncbi:MAG: hypothetical protein SVK54_00710 [candidate division WOR-3 bacterium]|nr:hypothetical protein [candidate division WOR-3 bacterium]